MAVESEFHIEINKDSSQVNELTPEKPRKISAVIHLDSEDPASGQ